MSIYDLLNNIETSKTLKSAIITINNDGLIIGSDERFTVIKTVQSNIQDVIHIEASYLYKVMSGFVKIINPIGAIVEDGYFKSVDNSILIENPIFKGNLNIQYNMFKNICEASLPIFTYENLRGDIVFEEALNKKSDEGITLFKITPDYILTLYKGLLPVNKADKVSLQVFDVDYNPTIFIGKFTVHKAKNVNVDVYIAYNKLG